MRIRLCCAVPTSSSAISSVMKSKFSRIIPVNRLSITDSNTTLKQIQYSTEYLQVLPLARHLENGGND